MTYTKSCDIIYYTRKRVKNKFNKWRRIYGRKRIENPQTCLNCQYHETYYTKCTTTFCKHKGILLQIAKVTKTMYLRRMEKKTGKITRDFHKEVASEVVTKMAKDILIIAQILCDDKIDEREESK